MKRAPRLPLPPVLRSDVVGTWAYDTMSRRVRSDILGRVFRENEFTSPNILSALRKLDDELANAESTILTPIEDDGGPDVKEWNEVILKEILDKGETWLSAPWCDAEFYLYVYNSCIYAFSRN